MSKIEELIKRLCPNGVKYDTLDKLCETLKKGTLKTTELKEDGEYPVINSGRDFYGYYDDYNNEGIAFTLAARGEYAGFINYIEDKFWAGGLCYPYRSKNEKKLITKFIYYYLKSKEKYIMETLVTRGSIPAINKSDIDKIKLPLPPYEVQSEIVNMMDKFTLLTSELNDKLSLELTTCQKQYDYYKDLLLENNDADKVKLGNCLLKVENIKWKQTDEQHQYIDLSSVDRESHLITETKEINKTNAPSRAQQIVKTNDVLFGGTRPMLKRYCLVNETYDNEICSTGFCVLRADTTKILPEWIYFMISTNDFYTYVEQNQKGASYPAISDADVKNYMISLPSIDEQKKLVKLLNNLEKKYNNLFNSLPIEIEKRQKQYEYYRDLLLNFKEVHENE